MVQHGAVLQDNSNTRLRQHRLASSCYNFQKNARVVYLLYTAVFWTNKKIKNWTSVSAASGNFPIPICPT
jgi:hypothetical protein